VTYSGLSHYILTLSAARKDDENSPSDDVCSTPGQVIGLDPLATKENDANNDAFDPGVEMKYPI
jgi:hypothetical protein